jgi:hypothetical protein
LAGLATEGEVRKALEIEKRLFAEARRNKKGTVLEVMASP